MEELADDLKIKITDLNVNQLNNSTDCRLHHVNKTYSKFIIPFEKCSTLQSVR